MVTVKQMKMQRAHLVNCCFSLTEETILCFNGETETQCICCKHITCLCHDLAQKQ